MRRIPTVQELEHIAAKFILNLPKEELVEERLGFHFQYAYFYYLDISCKDMLYAKKDRAKETIQFCTELLKVVSCPQIPKLTGAQMHQLIEQNYFKIPVNGIIIMNREENKLLFVESKETNKLGFPKGKIREGETAESCAMREVYEQIGVHIRIDPTEYVEVTVNGKSETKTYSKICRFFITRVEQACIVPRYAKEDLSQKTGFRQIIHSTSQIRSIDWYGMGPEITKLMEKGMVNTPSKLAYFELTKRQKATQYKEKKSQNPLDEFKGFDSRKLGQIFQR